MHKNDLRRELTNPKCDPVKDKQGKVDSFEFWDFRGLQTLVVILGSEFWVFLVLQILAFILAECQYGGDDLSFFENSNDIHDF